MQLMGEGLAELLYILLIRWTCLSGLHVKYLIVNFFNIREIETKFRGVQIARQSF